MFKLLKSFSVLMLICLSPVASAQTVPAIDDAMQGLRAYQDADRVMVRSVVDGDTLVLDTGIQVRLVGIQAPKLPLGRKGFEKWSLADEAKLRLEQLTVNRPVQLYVGPTDYDRHGRLLAHIVVENGGRTVWVQQQMLEEGLARVYSFADNRYALIPLLLAEATARNEGRAIWADAYYSVLSSQKIAEAVKSRTYFGDRFELVEGTVVDVTMFRDVAYVNFGADWRDDFSLVIRQEDFGQFGVDPVARNKMDGKAFIESLKSKRIRVRGWTYLKNGPMMRVTHKERIEILSAE